jgi:gamma-glutamylcyclotransferase (GGCT)/AIG2-like uncharacterized protein YtfP/NTP pyrophosphatase (non-canonical NTP hydrolase)
MQLLFVYGSLKQGFANDHVNTGQRVEGRFRTQEPFVLCLHGTGEVPCLLSPAGEGHQVFGELYEVTPDDLARMDLLERVGDADGYERVDIAVERIDGPGPTICRAQAYMKRATLVPQSDRRTEALQEYLPAHAARFHWVGRPGTPPAPAAPAAGSPDASTPPDSLQHLAQALDRFASEREWQQFHSPKNLASALVVEAGELLEHFMWMPEEQSRSLSPETREAVGAEVADVLLYLIQLARALDIDPIAAAQAKMQRNALRYPADRTRGNSRKCDAL